MVPHTVPLAEGVEDFQVEYAFDTNNDGTPETLLTTVTGGTTPTAFWSNVVAVRVHLLLRSTEQGGTTSPGVYDLGWTQRRDLPGQFQMPAAVRDAAAQ
jgi:hypothetical protein